MIRADGRRTGGRVKTAYKFSLLLKEMGEKIFDFERGVERYESIEKRNLLMMVEKRNLLMYVGIVVGLVIVISTLLNYRGGLASLVLSLMIAPLILWALDLGRWQGVKLIGFSSVAVATAMYVFPAVYGIMGDLFGFGFVTFILLIVCVVAPFYEELGKGVLWFVSGGDWREGAAIGAGFGMFESASYMAHFGMDIWLIRWSGIGIHMLSTAVFFRGFNKGDWRYCAAAIGIHAGFNTLMMFLGGYL